MADPTTTPSRDQIRQAVFAAAAKIAGTDAAQLSDTTHLIHDLNFDSLEDVELIMELEDELEVSLSDDVRDGPRTLGEIIERIDTLLRSPGG